MGVSIGHQEGVLERFGKYHINHVNAVNFTGSQYVKCNIIHLNNTIFRHCMQKLFAQLSMTSYQWLAVFLICGSGLLIDISQGITVTNYTATVVNIKVVLFISTFGSQPLQKKENLMFYWDALYKIWKHAMDIALCGTFCANSVSEKYEQVIFYVNSHCGLFVLLCLCPLHTLLKTSSSTFIIISVSPCEA